MKKVLHICPLDKFIPPFIDFIEKNFTFSKHEFRVFGKAGAYYLKPRPNIHIAKKGLLGRVKAYSQLIISMHQAKKIILHGLFIPPVVKILWAMPWLLKKCYWVMWGADLYVYSLAEKNKEWKRNEFFRRPVIRNMGNFVAYIKGEHELAKKWYGAKGRQHRCFMYPSNLYTPASIAPNEDSSGVNILVGNSADPNNNHLEIFDRLEGYKEKKIMIYAPLSYGDQDYAKQIIIEGDIRFGDKFVPLIEMLTFDKYLDLLSKIDIAIFNHQRQQAMGNIRTLLGLGKKVYMNQTLTSAICLKEDGIKTFSIADLNLKKGFNERSENIKNIKKVYSEASLVQCLNAIFEGG